MARENPFVLPKSAVSSSVGVVASPQTEKLSEHTLNISESSALSTSSKESSFSSESSLGMPLQEVRFLFLKARVFNDRIEFFTADRLKKSFFIDEPTTKIVLDFEATRIFPTKRIELQSPLFTKLEIGAHKSFYRVAVTVSKKCRHHIEQKRDHLTLTCK